MTLLLAWPPEIPPVLLYVAAVLFGLIVGSFLNAAIYRLPREGMTLLSPKRSVCPNCARQVRARENLPVVSWLMLRGKCAGCGWPIPWRYPFVELLTGGLFLLAAWRAPEGALGLIGVWWLVLAGLVVATFVDFDFFEIPDEVSIGGMVVGPVASLLVPKLHASTWIAVRLSEGDGVDRFGALFGSAAGLLVGGGVLYAIGALGTRLFGRDAMGFGDVKLLAAGGAFVGPGGALAALLLGAFIASFFGVANMVRFTCLSRRRARSRGSERSFASSFQVGRIAARYLPFGPYLALGIGIVMLDWNHVLEHLRGLFSV